MDIRNLIIDKRFFLDRPWMNHDEKERKTC